MTNLSSPETSAQKSTEERRQILNQAVSDTIARPGTWRVESQTDEDAVLVVGKKTNHTLHLILTLATFGLWLPVWVVLAVLNREHVHALTVDAYGNITTRVDGSIPPPTLATETRWIWRPRTLLGLWAVRLTAVWLLVGALAAVFYFWVPGGEWANAVLLYGVSFAAAIAGGTLAVIAIKRDRERAITVYAAVLPLLFLAALFVIEVLQGGEH